MMLVDGGGQKDVNRVRCVERCEQFEMGKKM